MIKTTALLDDQMHHWEQTFAEEPDLFGDEPSDPAQAAAKCFLGEGQTRILELGCGTGRDSLFFLRSGFDITAIDYAEPAVEAVRIKAQQAGLSARLTVFQHDVRNPLPFADASFNGAYSHMLYCMALTTADLEFVSEEIRRVLMPGGLSIYSVRHTGDPHYGRGVHRGEDRWEFDGFIVHFFSKEKVTRLAKGYEIIDIKTFTEGKMPRRLFMVTLKKSPESRTGEKSS